MPVSITPLRSPEGPFQNLPAFPWSPHYVSVPDPLYGSLRMHYLDEGPRDGRVVVLLHGQGCWSYAYREFVGPLVKAGLRVIAPDYVGFGRSDKLRECEHYSFQSHLDWLAAFFDALGLCEVIAYCFDWGGFFALRLAGERPELFGRLVLSNTMLPLGQGGSGRDWFIRWREQQFALPCFPQGEMVNSGVVRKLSAPRRRACAAPFEARIWRSSLPRTTSIEAYISSLLHFASRCSPPLEMRASAMCFKRSTDRVTFAVMGRRRNFWIFASFSVA